MLVGVMKFINLCLRGLVLITRFRSDSGIPDWFSTPVERLQLSGTDEEGWLVA